MTDLLALMVRSRYYRLFYLVLLALLVLILFNGTFLLSYSQSFRIYENSNNIKQKLLVLGKQYVESLANEQANVQDGPYSGYETHYDLKKSLAILLESIMQRLTKVESIVGVLNSSSSLNKDSILNARDLLSGAQEICTLPSNINRTHEHCEEKVKWMETFWKSDPCYAAYGVDGSLCSFIIYLSEVERYCPSLPWRPLKPSTTISSQDLASPNFNVEGLFELMKDNPTNFQWIKMRVERLWPKWKQAYVNLETKQNYTLNKRAKRKIFLHLGFLTKESGFKFGEKSMKGGPLGELVQWSDLIASLYILGHELIISSEINTFKAYAQADETFKTSCPVLNDKSRLDIIFTDIVGMKQIKKKIPASLQNYKCRLRVLDSFGTHAEFNDQSYFMKHKDSLGFEKTRKNPWGGHTLNLQQFYNMYPHTPDNTFLGFIVETYDNVSHFDEKDFKNPEKEDWALIYGKEYYMWKDSEDLIKTIAKHYQVHATVADGGRLPDFVVNHGVLSGPDLHKLLRKSKLFVGLGFPYEGPAPLEAVANGAIFINPKFSPPKGRLTDKFFSEKPTLRELTSQNPYAEDFIGEPHVLTIDINNLSAVEAAILKAKNTQVDPFLPFEFTHEGMLERVNVLVTHQDFCDPDHRNWPPFSASHMVLSTTDQSCKDACWKEGYICEGSYFTKINNAENLGSENFATKTTIGVDQYHVDLLTAMQAPRFTEIYIHAIPCPVSVTFDEKASLWTKISRFVTCQTVEKVDQVNAPSLKPSDGQCYLQNSPLLFSCASKSENFRRLCPCRDFVKDQTAICAACL